MTAPDRTIPATLSMRGNVIRVVVEDDFDGALEVEHRTRDVEKSPYVRRLTNRFRLVFPARVDHRGRRRA
jgi:hypothetical protein